MEYNENTDKPEETAALDSRLKVKIKNFLSFSALFWVMLWFSINTGPWVFSSEPESTVEWLHWLRTLFPILILFFTGILILIKQNHTRLPGNVKQWLFYGIIGLLASVLSSEPLEAAYWACAYLSAFAVMKSYLSEKDTIDSVRHLNILSLLIVTIFVLILIFFSWDVLYVETTSGFTGYGIESRMPVIAQMPMSRSSGIARFSAVPGILCFVFLWFGSDWKRFLWIIPLIFFGWVVYLMQSRGAVFSFGFVLAFEMLFLGGRKRIFAVFLLLLFGAMLLSDALPGKFFEEISDYMKRGQSIDEFQSMTGRTRIWDLAWQEILDAPIIGRGFQADRFFMGLHIHNTYLYALLTSGFAGAAVFVFGLLWSWRAFFRAMRYEDDQKHKIFLIQAGGILAFFTVRGITEVSGTMFNVDFMIILPIIAYLGILDSKYPQATKIVIEW